jgi:hypothetical protein
VEENGGCYLSASFSQNDVGGRLSRTSGYAFLDQVMPQEGRLLSSYFGVSPGFAFLMDLDAPNAYATPNAFFSGTQGTVLFGIKLITSEISASPVGGNALIAIMAHEWCHILQYKNGLQAPGARMELAADLMAGWWLGMKARTGLQTDPSTAARSLFQKGDFAFFSQQHHGTPQQRVQHFAAGFQMAVTGSATTANRAFQSARQFTGL